MARLADGGVRGAVDTRENPSAAQPAQLVSHTEPSPIATPTGNVDAETVATTRLVAGSMCVRLVPATQTPALASAAIPFNFETLRPPSETGITASTAFVSGLNTSGG